MITVVTGASGHLGANLVRALLARGRKVRVLIHQNTRGVEGLNVECVRGDVLAPDSLIRCFEGADVVYHCAGKISLSGFDPPSSLETNTAGSRHVARACMKAGVTRLVHFSSVHALSEKPFDRPLTEENDLCRKEESFLPYSLSKAEGENAILNAVAEGLDAVILNPSAILGPHDYALSPMGETVRDLAEGRFPALIDGFYNYVDVRDVSEAALAAEARGRKGERYLVGGHRLSLRDLAEMIAEITGTRAPRWTCPMWLARGAAHLSTNWNRIRGRRPKFTPASLRVLQGNSHLDCSKAAAELGHAPRPMLETLADTLAWQRKAGVLK